MNFFTEEDIIYKYTRAQAIEDGVLIDVTPTAKEVGFKYPVAVTSTLWGVILESYDADGSLWDVLWMLRVAIRNIKPTDLVYFTVRIGKRDIRLKSVCGPGDDSSPVITVMFPEED